MLRDVTGSESRERGVKDLFSFELRLSPRLGVVLAARREPAFVVAAGSCDGGPPVPAPRLFAVADESPGRRAALADLDCVHDPRMQVAAFRVVDGSTRVDLVAAAGQRVHLLDPPADEQEDAILGMFLDAADAVLEPRR